MATTPEDKKIPKESKTKKIPRSPIEIVQEGNAVLRKKAQLVSTEEIPTPKIQRIIADMVKALDSQDDGVGIAAPQIGHSLAIFVISGKALERIEASKNEDQTDKENMPEKIKMKPSSPIIDVDVKKKTFKNLVFINPRIIKLSKEKKWMDEGCLSVRWLYGKVQRSIRATISAYDETGKLFERGGGGVLAHIYQHEVDHLDGTLFIDKAIDLEEMEPSEEK